MQKLPSIEKLWSSNLALRFFLKFEFKLKNQKFDFKQKLLSQK